jgi:hypothetical protein
MTSYVVCLLLLYYDETKVVADFPAVARARSVIGSVALCGPPSYNFFLLLRCVSVYGSTLPASSWMWRYVATQWNHHKASFCFQRCIRGMLYMYTRYIMNMDMRRHNILQSFITFAIKFVFPLDFLCCIHGSKLQQRCMPFAGKSHAIYCTPSGLF